jgi:hypothetical protein
MRSLDPIKRLITGVAAIGLLVGNSGIANADSRTINFEPSQGYHPGSIQDQPGVTSPPAGWGGSFPPGVINTAIDQKIVFDWPGRPASFGHQSWRISNAYASGSFGDMPFSPSLTNEAGETSALNSIYSGGTRQNHFEAQWSFWSVAPAGRCPDPVNPPPLPPPPETSLTCSYVSISPDRGDGARMSYIRLDDHPDGIEVHFSDYQDNAPRGTYGSPVTAAPGCGDEDVFTDILVATVARNRAHSVRLSIDFIDGPHNDVVKVYVDDELKHVGTTWEDYFRWCPESLGGTGDPTFDQSRTVDSLLFRVGGRPHPMNLGLGFLIDNLSYSSSLRQTCGRHGDGDGDVEDGHGGHGHANFHKSGCDNSNSDSVRHDDDQSGHHFQSSSVNSSEYSTTASGGRSITMVGTGTDNGLPVGFTMVAVDNDGLLPATYSIVLTNGYSFVGTFLNGSVVSIQ